MRKKKFGRITFRKIISSNQNKHQIQRVGKKQHLSFIKKNIPTTDFIQKAINYFYTFVH